MNGAQANGNKRKSSRLAADRDDDNTPPTKRAKGDVATKHASGKAGAAGGGGSGSGGAGAGATQHKPLTSNVRTRSKKQYEEDDDGFSFSRTRSKKAGKANADTAAGQAQQAPQPQPPPAKDADAPHASDAAAQSTRLGQKRPRRTLPPSPQSDRENAPRRRSARLSRDNGAVEAAIPHSSEQEPAARRHGLTTPRARHQSPVHSGSPAVAAPESLHVDKARRETRIPLPFADTPIIRRNKEMRKTSAEQSRRSSAGMRGRRASSLIDAGTSHAVPHAEVEPEEFYKHISQDLVEPKRMRQLLVWCANRALPEKRPSGQQDADETAAMHAARVIQEELLNDFGSRPHLSNWFDREDVPPAVLVKKPNPRNVKNAEKLQQLEAELARLQEEKRSWEQLMASTTATLGNRQTRNDAHTDAPGASADPTPALSLDPRQIDASALDPSQAEILQQLLLVTTTTAQAEKEEEPKPQALNPEAETRPPTDLAPTAPSASSSSSSSSTTPSAPQHRIATLAHSLEQKLDHFASAAHRMEQFRQTADRVAARVLGVGAQKLEDREAALRGVRRVGNGDKGGTIRGVGQGGAGTTALSSVGAMDAMRSLARVLHGKGEEGRNGSGS